MPFTPSIQGLIDTHTGGQAAAVDWQRNRVFEMGGSGTWFSRFGLLTGTEEAWATLASVSGQAGFIGLAANGNIFLVGPSSSNGSALYVNGSTLALIDQIDYSGTSFGGSGLTGVLAGSVQYLVDHGSNVVIPTLNRVLESSTTTFLAHQDNVGAGGKTCAGVAGSGIAYMFSPDSAGAGPITLSKLLFDAGGFVSNTVIGAITMASIDPVWTTQFSISGVCLDQTDGKLLAVITGIAGTERAYLTKIDPITAGVDWKTAIPRTDGGGPVVVNDTFQFSSITHQRVAFYTGSPPTVTIYNTATGAVDTTYTSGINGLFPRIGGQCYNDSIGGIVIGCDFGQVSGSPTLLNSTPTSWTDGWAVLYVAAAPTPPPGSRRFLAHMGPVRGLHLGHPTPPPQPTNAVGSIGLNIDVSGVGIGGSTGTIALDVAVAGVGLGGTTSTGTINLNVAVAGVGSGTPSSAITTLRLSNTSGSTETPQWSKFFGHAFADSDATGCPLNGSNPTYPIFKISGTTISYSMSEPTYWPSGRLKHAMFWLLLGGNYTIANNATLIVSVNASNSQTSKPTASGRTTADFSAADLKVLGAILDGPSPGTSYISSLNVGIADALSDNFVWADGPAGKMWRIRCRFKNAGTPEGNLEGYCYVASMLDGSGNFGGIRVLFEISTPLGDSTASLRVWKSFSALTLQSGSTVLRDLVTSGRTNTGNFTWGGGNILASANNVVESFQVFRVTTTGVLPAGLAVNTTYCAYNGNYYTPPFSTIPVYDDIRLNNPVIMTNSGSGIHTFHTYPWVTAYGSIYSSGTTAEYDYVQGGGSVTPISSLVDTAIQVKADMVYMRATKTIPAYDYTAPVTPGPLTPFYINTNCGLTNNPDATGIDEHIGILPTPLVRYLYTQSLTDERNVRATGLAGGQIGAKIRVSSQGATMPAWNNGTGGTGTPYSGMGTLLPFLRYGNSLGTTDIFPPFNSVSYGTITGQAYADGSHKVSYSWLAYWITGEPQYLGLVLDNANCPAGGSFVGGGDGITNTRISTSRYQAYGDPTADGNKEGSRIVRGPDSVVRYCMFQLTNSPRQDGWFLRDLGRAAGSVPQNYPECPAYFTYLNDVAKDNMAWVVSVIAVAPTSYASTNGLFNPQAGGIYTAQFMDSYWIEALADYYGHCQDANALTAMNAQAKWHNHVVNTFGLNPISNIEWRTRQVWPPSGGGPVLDNDNGFGIYQSSQPITNWTNGSANFSFDTSVTGSTYVPAVNDLWFFESPSPGSQQTDPIPSAFTVSTAYHVISVTGAGAVKTVQLSATQGGSAIVNTDSITRTISLWVQPAVPLNTLDSNGVNDYPTVHYRSLLLAQSRGATVNAAAMAAMAAAVPTASAFGTTPTYCFNGTA